MSSKNFRPTQVKIPITVNLVTVDINSFSNAFKSDDKVLYIYKADFRQLNCKRGPVCSATDRKYTSYRSCKCHIYIEDVAYIILPSIRKTPFLALTHTGKDMIKYLYV